MKKATLICLMALFLNACCSIYSKRCSYAPDLNENSLLLLKNDNAVVGIMPQVGGRIVLYRLTGGPNMLLSDSSSWTDKPKQVSLRRPYGGHTIWLGPQNEWWIKQCKNILRKKNKSTWPPDPTLDSGVYTVIEKKDDYVKLLSPKSEASGVQLTKEVKLLPSGEVELKFSLKNIRKKSLSWDIWSNTRVPADGTAYVPLKAPTEKTKNSYKLKLEHKSRDLETYDIVPYKTINRIFFFDTKAVLKNFNKTYSAKAFLYYPAGAIYYFNKNWIFIKQASLKANKMSGYSQSPIEIYQLMSPQNPASNIIELEMHGPYTEVLPGKSIFFTERWQIRVYSGPQNTRNHLKYLQGIRATKNDSI